MTLRELNQYFDLRERLAQSEALLAAFRRAAHPGAQALTGMPRALGVSDKVGDLAAEIADLESSICGLLEETARREAEITAFISAISDNQTRMIFRLRFLRGLTWGEVAATIGGRNSESAVKNICYRYLESCDGPGAMVLDDSPPDVLC